MEPYDKPDKESPTAGKSAFPPRPTVADTDAEIDAELAAALQRLKGLDVAEAETTPKTDSPHAEAAYLPEALSENAKLQKLMARLSVLDPTLENQLTEVLDELVDDMRKRQEHLMDDLAKGLRKDWANDLKKQRQEKLMKEARAQYKKLLGKEIERALKQQEDTAHHVALLKKRCTVGRRLRRSRRLTPLNPSQAEPQKLNNQQMPLAELACDDQGSLLLRHLCSQAHRQL
jgi:hypothetical protein